MDHSTARVTDEEALLFHSMGKPGKLEINATKPLTTQRDLTLAYSPGVAIPSQDEAAPGTTPPGRVTGKYMFVIPKNMDVISVGSRPDLSAAIPARNRPGGNTWK